VPSRAARTKTAMAVGLALGLTALPVLAGCSSAAPAPQASTRPISPVTILASPMAPAKYQHLLTAIDEKLAADTRLLRAARTPLAVSAAATKAQNDISADVSQLQKISAPAALRAAQAALISALRDFGTDLGSASTAAGADQVCAGSSAVAMLSRSGAAAQLRSADSGLATADPAAPVQMGSFLPPVTADTDRRLANGATVKRTTGSGLGQLVIDNGGSTDALVDLVLGRGHAATMAIYVRARSSSTTTGIGDGTYQVYVTSGTDWDSGHHLITRNCYFEKFDKSIPFTTRNLSNETQYTRERITLTAVPGGNVTVSQVRPEQFPVS